MKQIVYNNDKLSKLSLGTVQFGLDYGIANNSGQPTQNEVNEIVEYVYSNNINCFDTAQAYGTSELVLGEAIKTKKDLFVISKLKSNLFINNLESNINKSLNNLNIDCLYGLLLHDSQLLYTWSKEYGLLVDNLIGENKIRYFGVSIYTNEDFELALNNDSISFIQIPFNIFDQRAISKKWFEKAEKYIGEDVGAIWGLNIDIIPNVKNKLFLKSLGFVARECFKLRGGMHDTLLRLELVKDISIPEKLHSYEDAYIINWIRMKGYKVVIGDELYCLHYRPPEDWNCRESLSLAALEIKCGLVYSRIFRYAFYYPFFIFYWLLQLFSKNSGGHYSYKTSQR